MQSMGQKTGGDIVVTGTAVLRAGRKQPGGVLVIIYWAVDSRPKGGGTNLLLYTQGDAASPAQQQQPLRGLVTVKEEDRL